jgi:hypothetical protein
VIISKAGLREGLSNQVPDSQIVSNDLKFIVARLLLCIEYFNGSHIESKGNYYYYVFGGFGGIRSSASGELVVRSGSNTFPIRGRGKDTRPAATAGFGIVRKLNAGLGVDLGGSVDMMYAKSPSGVIYQAIIVDIRAGLVFAL